MSFELAVDNYKKISNRVKDYGSFISESDTRAKIIDEILKKCLDWDETNIAREEYVHKGFIDYKIKVGGKGLIIEAKKIGIPFALPVGISYSSNLRIKDLLKKDPSLNEFYEQVTKYCLESSIQFGCFTNGESWVIFPAFRKDAIELRNSRVIVFKDFKEIGESFIHFWNVLSKDAVNDGNTERILLGEVKPILPSYVINYRERRDIVLHRNILSGVLSPILQDYFSDLTGPNSLEKLERCYVDSKESVLLSTTTGDYRGLSKTVSRAPSVTQYDSIEKIMVDLNWNLKNYLENSRQMGAIYTLLGRVGSGKTTFLYHFFYVSNKDLQKKHLVFYLNCLELSQQSISDFFIDKVATISNDSAMFRENSKINTLEKVFEKEIFSLKEGILGNIKDENIISLKISERLNELSKNKILYYSKLFSYLKQNQKISTIIIFDNIDQLEPKQQDEILNFAFSIYLKWNSFTLIALREESYVKSKKQGSLSTVQSQTIYLPKQSIMPILDKRLECLANDLASERIAVSPLISNFGLTALDIRQYVLLIKNSIISDKVRVKDFLENIALGNLRESLDFFKDFLTSENTDTAKIIDYMKKGEKYLVPGHEFIKSISLKSKQFFAECESPILNLFSIMDMQSPSYFTKMRILYILNSTAFQAGPYGLGYQKISKLIEILSEIDTSKEDIKNSIDSLTLKGLIENDYHSKKYRYDANSVRITPTGDYYLKFLSNQFIYLDLMHQETPYFDREIFNQLLHLSDLTSMEERIQRCQIYVQYLKQYEDMELKEIKKITKNEFLTHAFMPNLIIKFDANVQWIQEKMNRKEKYEV
jgi:hypothetical protein